MSVINIVFQSNSIDGWFSAYLTSQLATQSENDLVFFHPIDAKNPESWPEHEKLVPLSANKAADLTQAKQKAFCYFIDCTPTLANNTVCSEYLVDICRDFTIVVIDNNPVAATIDPISMILVKHDCHMTTISQVWRYFGMAHAAMIDWVQQVNRIESWSMIDNDRSIRENLLEICRLPTMGRIPVAIHRTDQYVNTFTNIDAAEIFLAEGNEKLKTKIAGFAPLLSSTRIIILTTFDCARLRFPMAWAGKILLYVDSTGYAPDSSELAACAFEKFSTPSYSAAEAEASKPDFFINFRRRTHSGSAPTYIYSARVSPTSYLSLIEPGSPFKGFEKSAGAIISSTEFCVPFVK